MALVKEHWKVTPPHDHDAVLSSANALLAREHLAAFSVQGTHGPLVWTAFFAVVEPRGIVVLTSRISNHGAQLHADTPVSLCVFERCSEWGNPIYGLQAAGVVANSQPSQLSETYSRRFPQYAKWVDDGGKTQAEFLLIELRRIKLVDEARFGEEVFIEAEFEIRQ